MSEQGAVAEGGAARLVGRVQQFFDHDIWVGAVGAGARRRVLYRVLRIGVVATRGLSKGNITHQASSLAYTTLVSLVPTLAIAFSLFKAFGGLESMRKQIEQVVISNLAVGAQSQVEEYLRGFVDNVHAGTIGGLGSAGLFFTVVGLLTGVEQAFNQIWGIQKTRSFVQRFTIYTTLILFGPVLIGVSFSVTAAVTSESSWLWLIDHVPFGPTMLGVVARFVPLMLSALTFSLMYVIMPNTKVRPVAALIGGVTAGVLFEVLKIVYAYYSAKAVGYSAIYGALAAIPLFLLWIYLTWLVILFGAQVVFATETSETYEVHESVLHAPIAVRERVALRIYLACAERFVAAKSPLSDAEIARHISAPVRLVRSLVGTLVEAGLLAAAAGQGGAQAYLVARDPAGVSPYDVLRALRQAGSVRFLLHDDATTAEVERLTREADDAVAARLSGPDFRTLAIRLTQPGLSGGAQGGGVAGVAAGVAGGGAGGGAGGSGAGLRAERVPPR